MELPAGTRREHARRGGPRGGAGQLSGSHLPIELTHNVRRFLRDAQRYATIATLNPDGSPHQAVVWFLLREDHIVLNSKAGRRWPGNLLRDPRLSLTVEDGLDAVTLGGRAEHEDDPAQAQADIAEMARLYDDPVAAAREIARFQTEERLRFVFRPTRLHVHGDPR